ncbi:biopolymer transporter ExbD [Sediminibacterium sp.]|uniref:ExbD/TolR family protein n=1 Tax=Sediminibacterium sp. TaxID=1917865 RepID=UPI002721F2CD|nr:biopolymer transporter ExbD [Sediminibacterium sp.]MDO9000482.1 biopolymer transporter ExbD [Bacteroidota bacterium]MDP3146950.1 biopolymer transporter ExbD [Bacteroidota bacterium]MDP3567512.1 biopolymer transporter ExbD [Sediminibacterium sp.]
MSKKPSKGGAPALDMTPMVDLAFLLVTFFMLTASFRMAEPVVVDPPSSIGMVDLPDNHIMVTIDDKGRAFFGISNSTAKMNALRQMSTKYNVPFTEEQIIKFSGLPSFGVDIKDLPAYIDAKEDARTNFKGQRGVPLDTITPNNQLKDWISIGGTEAVKMYEEAKIKAAEAGGEFKAEKPRYAIKCAATTKYINVKDVIKTFTDLKLYQFNLITSLEGGGTVIDPTK